MVELNLGGRQEHDGEPTGLRRSSDHGLKVNWGLVVTVTVVVIGWLSGAFSENRNMSSRITALEALRSGDASRMERIENKIDRLLEARRP